MCPRCGSTRRDARPSGVVSCLICGQSLMMDPKDIPIPTTTLADIYARWPVLDVQLEGVRKGWATIARNKQRRRLMLVKRAC